MPEIDDQNRAPRCAAIPDFMLEGILEEQTFAHFPPPFLGPDPHLAVLRHLDSEVTSDPKIIDAAMGDQMRVRRMHGKKNITPGIIETDPRQRLHDLGCFGTTLR